MTSTTKSLTGLIFGRHHELFDFASHLQVYQSKAGFATILVSASPQSSLSVDSIECLFDSEGVSISFEFVLLHAPLRTKLGKVPLLVKVLPDGL